MAKDFLAIPQRPYDEGRLTAPIIHGAVSPASLSDLASNSH